MGAGFWGTGHELETAFLLVCCVGVIGALLATRLVPALGSARRSTEWAARALYTLLVGLLVAYTVDVRGGYSRSWGGATDRQYFNWHPTLMTVGFLVFGTEVTLAYRAAPAGRLSKQGAARAHAACSIASGAFAVAGLAVALRSHSGGVVQSPGSSAPIHAELGHFPTAHSWIGLVTLLVMLCQLAFGAARQCGFLQDETAHVYHRFIGLVTYSTAVVTAVLGLGNFVGADEARYTEREKELGVMTVVVWGIAACVLSPYVLPDRGRAERSADGEPSEESALIQQEQGP